jgi:hypothetical protein
VFTIPTCIDSIEFFFNKRKGTIRNSLTIIYKDNCCILLIFSVVTSKSAMTPSIFDKV